MPQLILTCFGTFQASLNQVPLVAFESNKARALLAYLALEAAQAHARATLAGLFWPEFTQNNARDNLRHALANLRALLPQPQVEPPFLLADRQTIQFNPQSSYHLDVADFSHAIASYRQHVTSIGTGQSRANTIAALEQASTLYRGPFLQGFFLDDCSAFEEWLLLTRERLHNQMLRRVRATLTEHFEGIQEYAKAESYARRWLTLDNLQEEAHCQLMRILARRGQRSAALSQYEQCRRVLAAEFGAPPSAETVALHQQIQRGLWEVAQPPLIQPIPVERLHRPAAPLAPPHNLPVPTTSFVGRTAEVAAICAFLCQPEVRLVTLHGTGGVGKTRLALQTTRQLLADCPETFADGCFWVELAPLRNAAQIPMALAQSLGISENSGPDPLPRLQKHLRDKALLLVVDNYEHLLVAAPLVADLLSHAAQLKCLVTSREPLHVRGEQEFAVPALTLPAPDSPLLPANPTHYEAVQLFIQRAQAVKPDFVVDSANLSVVAEICTRLDGLPLAIELAAARCKFFSLQTLRQKLETARLTFCRGARDMPDRHQTLHAVIEWSYNLLNTDKRKLFRRLAVFVGGFTLEAVKCICTLEADDAIDVLEIMISLVDKSLVRQTMTNEGESRFVLLETIREFGLQKLGEGDNRFVIQHYHADFYHNLANGLCPQLLGANGVRSLAQLRTEYPDLHAALQWLLANRQIEQSLRLCNMLLYYWSTVGGKEALGYFEAVLHLAADCPPTPEYINALANAGYASFILNSKGAGGHYFEQCLALNKAAGNVGDPIKIGTANGLLGWIRFDQGDYQTARAYLAAAKQNDLATGAEWALAMTLANQGSMEARLGEFEQAHRLLAEALARHRRLGDISTIASMLLRQSITYVWQNRFEAAATCLAQSYHTCQKIQSYALFADFYRISALIAHHRGENRQANQHLREALLIRQKAGAPRYLVEILETTILIFIGQNRHQAELVIASAISAYRQKLNLVAPPVEKKLIDDALTQAHQQLTPQAAAAAWTRGQSMTLDEAVTYGLAEL